MGRRREVQQQPCQRDRRCLLGFSRDRQQRSHPIAGLKILQLEGRVGEQHPPAVGVEEALPVQLHVAAEIESMAGVGDQDSQLFRAPFDLDLDPSVAEPGQRQPAVDLVGVTAFRQELPFS